MYIVKIGIGQFGSGVQEKESLSRRHHRFVSSYNYVYYTFSKILNFVILRNVGGAGKIVGDNYKGAFCGEL